jgi:hypothetical protein
MLQAGRMLSHSLLACLPSFSSSAGWHCQPHMWRAVIEAASTASRPATEMCRLVTVMPAMDLSVMEVACRSFDCCLSINPTPWPALGGILHGC